MNAMHPLVAQLALNMSAEGGNTLVCAGIDPDWNRIQGCGFKVWPTETTQESVLSYVKRYVDIVAPHVAAFKPNLIYWLGQDKHDWSKALAGVIAYIHSEHPNLPVILDCKAGDVEHSMEKWLKLVFDYYGADGIVINPYLGDEVFAALDAYADKLIVSCCRTSNPGAARVQDQQLASGRRVWEQMLVDSTGPAVWNRHGNVIPVLSSTAEFNPLQARGLMCRDQPILFAGVGAQGGSLAHFSGLLNEKRSGVMVGSSRALMYPKRELGETWEQAVARAVTTMRAGLNSHR